MDISFLQSSTTTDSLTTYTFSSENLGTAASDRYIFVTVHARATGNSAYSVSSVTIGGVSASIAIQATGAGSNDINRNQAAIVLAAVPTGTTGDIVVTMNRASIRCAIGVYRVTGLGSTTAHDTDFDAPTSLTSSVVDVSLDIPADGFAIGAGHTADAGTAAWTGLTEDYEGNAGSSFWTATGAHDEFVSSETGRAIQITWGGANDADAVLVAGSWAFSSGGQTIAIGAASESDTAVAVSPVKPIVTAIGAATEADVAVAVLEAGATVVTIGAAAETDTAETVTPRQPTIISIDPATETDLVEAVVPVKGIVAAIAAASETDVAETIAVIQATVAVITPATETDTAETTTIVKPIVIAIGAVSETDVAEAVLYAALEPGPPIAVVIVGGETRDRRI